MPAKSVVVTGAGSGIGRAVCLAAATRGWAVAALDIDAASAQATAAEAKGRGEAQATGVECDVSDAESVRLAFDAAESTLGPGWGVVANAGVEANALLHEFDPADWHRVVDVNLGGVFLTCREALDRLVRAGTEGSIVCTSSPSAFVGFAGGGNSAYAASKGGVSALVRSAALDYAPRGIRINAVVPGATDTAMLGSGDFADRAREQIPLGRLARPGEIAAAVMWLLSDDASYVTGSHLVCDGGLMAKSANDF